MGLFPVVEVPEFQNTESQIDRQYRSSIAWDIETGDFIRDGTNRLVKCDGLEAYRIWCYKVAQTERFRSPAYSSDIGVEMESALKEETFEAVISAVERTITEALMANPRTETVGGFSFENNGDSLCCEFLVKGIDWERFPVRITI